MIILLMPNIPATWKSAYKDPSKSILMYFQQKRLLEITPIIFEMSSSIGSILKSNLFLLVVFFSTGNTETHVNTRWHVTSGFIVGLEFLLWLFVNFCPFGLVQSIYIWKLVNIQHKLTGNGWNLAESSNFDENMLFIIFNITQS